jgi:hypothetical protein
MDARHGTPITGWPRALHRGDEAPAGTDANLEDARAATGWTRCFLRQALLATHAARSLRVDLDGVTFIDAAGRAFVRSMRAHGASLAATDVMRRTIGDEVVPRAPRKPAKRRLDG